MILPKTQRNEEMKKLRAQGKTLIQIAKKFSVSRERVRQVVGSSGKSFIRTYITNNINVDESMTVQDVDKLFEGWGKGILIEKIRKIHHKAVSGNAAKGEESEARVSQKLAEHGIKNRLMPLGHSYDIELENGKRIDVKSAHIKNVTSKAQKHEMYRFRTRTDEKNDCDFFICHIVPHDAFFVIPKHEVSGSGFLYIAYPESGRSWSKWLDYKDRFDLLR